MESIRELYRIGPGPSSSHTMAPRRAAEVFRSEHPDAATYRVTLYGSLAATGTGHLTDVVLAEAFDPVPVAIVWKADEQLPAHPNGMCFEALDGKGGASASWEVYSVGGGALRWEGAEGSPARVYDLDTMTGILARCEETGQTFWEYVEDRESADIWGFLAGILGAMRDAIERGIRTEGVLPGGLGLARKAWAWNRKARTAGPHFRRNGLL